MDKDKDKIVFKGGLPCPYCRKKIKLEIVKTILTPGIKAETQLKINSEKDEQQELQNA